MRHIVPRFRARVVIECDHAPTGSLSHPQDDVGAIVHLTPDEVADFPVGEVTLEGKTLQVGESVDAAKRTLRSSTVKVLPVLDGRRYVGAVDGPTIEDAGGDAQLATLAQALVPLARETTRAGDALATLEAHGGTRLVVVDEDDRYLGIVCLRGDRTRLCIDAARLRVLA